MRKIYLLLVLVLLCNAIKALPKDNIAVSIDVESANMIVRLLKGKTITAIQMDKTVAMYGSQQLIKKVKGYSGSGEDVFRVTLKEIIESGKIKGNDPYNWQLVKTNLPQIELLLAKIAVNKTKLIADVTEMIKAYAGDDMGGTFNACFLVGGGSLGFVNGKDKTFNVALQKLGDDYEGLKYLIAHELYHSLQGEAQSLRKIDKDKNVPFNIEAPYAIIYYLWNEGTANLVGDFSLIKNPKSFSKIQQDALRKNDERNKENFYLLEIMLYKAANDTAANFNVLYDIGFTTSFDEALYDVGYKMAKKIIQYEGNKSIGEILKQDPIVFIEKYIALYKANPNDKGFVRFDQATEQIVANVTKWKDKI